VSLADVELPNRPGFTQYVFRLRRCAMRVVLDDAGERVLLMRRHRFIVDRWVRELPGGSHPRGPCPSVNSRRPELLTHGHTADGCPCLGG
jgi:hypothetical protein